MTSTYRYLYICTASVHITYCRSSTAVQHIFKTCTYYSSSSLHTCRTCSVNKATRALLAIACTGALGYITRTGIYLRDVAYHNTAAAWPRRNIIINVTAVSGGEIAVLP